VRPINIVILAWIHQDANGAPLLLVVFMIPITAALSSVILVNLSVLTLLIVLLVMVYVDVPGVIVVKHVLILIRQHVQLLIHALTQPRHVDSLGVLLWVECSLPWE